jgi:PAS domain-containing protein
MELDSRIAERALAGHPTDELFRLLVTSVADYAIFLLDPAGHVVSWNTGAERIKGYAAAEIVGRHLSVFYPEEQQAEGVPAAMLARAEREGRSQAKAGACARTARASGPRSRSPRCAALRASCAASPR